MKREGDVNSAFHVAKYRTTSLKYFSIPIIGLNVCWHRPKFPLNHSCLDRSRLFAAVTQGTRVMPEVSRWARGEQQKKNVARHEGHLRKGGARLRRDAAISGKAGR